MIKLHNINNISIYIYKKQNLLINHPRNQIIFIIITIMDQFDFDDIDDQVPKKPTNKKQQNKQPHKKLSNNKKDDDFFDIQQQIDSKPKQKKRNYPQDDDNQESNNNINDKKQIRQKQKQSILPKINLPKSPKNNNSTIKNKMDLTLENLPEKNSLNKQSQFKNKRKYSQQQNDQFTIHKERFEEKVQKQQLKTNPTPIKQKQQSFKPINTNPLSSLQSPKLMQKQPNHSQHLQINKPIQQKKIQQQEDKDQDYQQQYEEEIFDDQIITEKNIKKNAQKKDIPKEKKIEKAEKKSSPLSNNKPKQTKESKPIQPPPSKTQKPSSSTTSTDEKVNKYKQLVQKSFPSDQDEQKIQKLKSDTINRLNQKMRDMIKGFSNELTTMIDKNIFLLRKPQNQIKEQIEGQTNPIESQIKLLQEMKKNNQKLIQNTQKQLQSIAKTNEKIQSSVKSSAQINQQIQEFKNSIAIISKEISNLESDIQKQSRKVTKIEENNNKKGVSEEFKDSRFKNVLQITQKIEIHKLEFQKNKKKIGQLNQKLTQLEQKVAETTQKRRRILQKAQNEGISFHTKEQKKLYDDLKKKRDQYQLFESKFKSSITSKEAVIQHEMTDYEVIIAEYESKYEILNEQVQKSQEKIFNQIKQAKKNPKLHSNAKEILTQLEIFMNDENPNRSEEDQNSLNFISQKIYKKEYQGKTHSKTLNDEKANKKPDYKNYLKQVAKQNEQARNKSKTVQKMSQQNPFRKAVTPNESVQVLKPDEKKKAKSKQANQQQLQKQKQRIWKSSNTQILIRNPLKNPHHQPSNTRYLNKSPQPLQNKQYQLINLNNNQKQKIQLQQHIKLNKKPFKIGIGMKQQNQQQLNQLADITKQMEKIGKEIQTHRSSLMRESKLEFNQDQVEEKGEIKPNVVNKTPFKNIKLKKDKDKDKQKDKDLYNDQPQTKLPTQQIKPLSPQPNPPTPVQQDPVSFKPKRFNLRKRNQNQNPSYVPSARVAENNSQTIENIKSLNKPYPSEINNIQNKSKQQEVFDPFKKFMTNSIKDEKSISLAIEVKKEPLRIDDDKVATVQGSNNKPRINLFKKGVGQNEKEKKINPLGDENKEQTTNNQQILNPYAQLNTQKQSQVPKFQRQGRLKRMNPPPNTLSKPTNNHNIFADVEDATISANIKILGDPQPYIPQSINKNDQELNVNDLLGIKKKKVEVDKDLLIDLPGDNKVSVKKRARGKGGDFFNDLEL